MELSPRGGGNRLAEMVRHTTGEDMILSAVKAALGETIEIEQKACDGFWAEIILHSNQAGIFKELWVSKEIESNIVEYDLWINPGAQVVEFSCGGEAIGTIVLKFDTQEAVDAILEKQDSYISVVLQ